MIMCLAIAICCIAVIVSRSYARQKRDNQRQKSPKRIELRHLNTKNEAEHAFELLLSLTISYSRSKK